MSTPITLTLNGVTVDHGANYTWNKHHWLFPPGGPTQIPYSYAHGHVEVQDGFETTIGEARFRMSHLGYSEEEVAAKFDDAVGRWNRTSHLALTHETFRHQLAAVNFQTLTESDMAPYIWDFRRYILALLESWNTEDAGLEDFIFGLDFPLVLRAITEHPENFDLPIRWHYKDFVDSGWASFEDLTETDRPLLIAKHNALFAKLQAAAGSPELSSFDDWLTQHGVARERVYVKVGHGGRPEDKTLTLPLAVRHMIHHPENVLNTLSDRELHASLEQMLSVARGLES